MRIMRRLPIAGRFFGNDGENGVVLILTALSLVILLGMAAFSVDLGWLYYNQLKVRKAAEAAALAGVVHMPLPGCGEPVLGTEPYETALDLALTSGYEHGANATVTPSKGANCNQLSVNVATTVETFFMRVFGRDSFNINETATAEQLPPLHIGSDESYLGEDPVLGGSRLRQFYLAISGLERGKGSGDAYAAIDLDNGSANSESRDPSYWYAVEVVAGSASEGGTVQIQVYDGVTHDTDGDGNNVGGDGPAEDWQYAAGNTAGAPSGGASDNGSQNVTVFRVLAPDATPSEWTDNSVQLCYQDYHSKGSGAYESSARNAWDTICTIPNAAAGIYVVEVSVQKETNVINGFSLRTVVSGSTTNDTEVYGLGAMSLWQTDTGSNPVFKIVRLDEVYAGSELTVSLWDVSDIGSSSSGTLQFDNPIASAPINSIDCTKQVRYDTGSVKSAYGPDDGASNCFLSFNTGDYNNNWIDFKFDIPPDYTCVGSECWVYVSYGVSAGITDRTTWTASVNGQPIHLVP
jgi:hypothetical protein